jgi:pimeloyl-ACP methyl ester carboxylesterase
VVDKIHGRYRRLDPGWLYEDHRVRRYPGRCTKDCLPTLVITTEGSGLASVEETRAWQQIIPNSDLLVLPGNSYHVAASHAIQCAQATLAFIERGAFGE